ncbi:MAG: 5-(carboxyamino)imidazole ribonucleotide synthase [Leptolyngbya sp. SIO3F4]|nr:5-(carboxyamino)imidazole ribonucleotide synthase [Leptolyngbya sp. SIO3F4]
MMAQAAKPLGVACVVYDPSPDACAKSVAHLVNGSFDDARQLRSFAELVDVITYEFENVPNETVDTLDGLRPIHPQPEALKVSSNRVTEKAFFESCGVPVGPYRAISGPESLRIARDELGLPGVLKSNSGGYDGKGQYTLRTDDELENALAQIGNTPFIYESFVNFTRELSVIACRTIDGTTVTYPLAQNTHQHGILVRSDAPATVQMGMTEQAHSAAKRVGDTLNYVGVFAIELFDVGGELLANEMAPRVHNTGHWTIEGSNTSQFENHVRAVMGLPLGSTEPEGHSVMLNIIGEMPDPDILKGISGATLHGYGKAPRPGRKIGHITVNGPDRETCLGTAKQIQSGLRNTMPGGGVRP